MNLFLGHSRVERGERPVCPRFSLSPIFPIFQRIWANSRSPLSWFRRMTGWKL